MNITLGNTLRQLDPDWLSEDDKQTIKDEIKHLRHSGFTTNDVNRHQLGGHSRLIQEHEIIGCPKPDCKNHKLFFKDEFAGYHMKELAVLFNDPASGLPMIEPYKESSDWD